jgi:hypothetical protein
MVRVHVIDEHSDMMAHLEGSRPCCGKSLLVIHVCGLSR